MQWHFLDVTEHSGAANMQYDERLARALQSGAGMPTVRLYRWRPWAISLGFNQDLSQINLQRAREDGLDVVRRPTGGRAVLHAEELTYCVVMFAEGKTVLEVYNAISRALVRGLRRYGADVDFTKAQPDFREHYRHLSSIPCFTASARYEIEWRGRKLVGSAQRRFRSFSNGREIVLQHGSILLGPAHKRLVDYVILDDDARSALKAELHEKTADLSSIIHRTVELDDLSECLRKGFEEEWGISFVEGNGSLLSGEVDD
ncbi:MAG TPA: lipoate--protein ligase family protein [Bacteroidota bacterium]|nr:lipoate--protein ligase family protein [Bacteroidota bacterium]